MKKIQLLTVLAVGLMLGSVLVNPILVHASFNPNNLMDDGVFENYNSMTTPNSAHPWDGIDNWLNNTLGSTSCISSSAGFRTPDPHGWSNSAGAYTFGDNVTAGQAIYDTALLYHVNPQVIIATLQKEQSIPTGAKGCHYDRPNPADSSQLYTCTIGGKSTTCTDACPTSYGGGCMNIAMSYNCPGSCKASSEGFSLQLTLGTWLLRFGEQRSYGNLTGYVGYEQGDEYFCYYGIMTPGNRARSASATACGGTHDNVANYYDGTGTLADGNSVSLTNGATSTLYNFTPFISGNQSFINTFESWFDPYSVIRDNVTVRIITAPDATPARGEKVTYTFGFTNNSPSDLVVDAVGAVGRLGAINSTTNRDLGWRQGPITLKSGVEQPFSFTTTMTDTGTLYAWPAILYKGGYIQYNNWGSSLVIHAPNFTLSQPLTTDATTIYAGQNVKFSATLKNNEAYPISYDAIGIPVKLYDSYNYDAVWVGPGVIAAGAEIPISGTRNIDKTGPYTYWVSDYFGGTFTNVGSVKKFNATEATPNFSVAGMTFSSTSPVKGQDLTPTFTITNTLPVPIDVDAVGVVGRFGTFTGANRDIGWQGPVHFNAGETKTFTGSRTITDLGTHYYWIGILYKGTYLQYNNWGSTIISRAPSFSVSALSFTNTSPAVGENLGASFNVTNNLDVPIDVDAVGVVGRFGTFTGPNRDIGWQGPIHFNAGQTIPFSGYSRTITDIGTHYYWIGILYKGEYLQYNNWGSTIISHS